MKIVPLSDLLDAMSSEPKPYVSAEFGRMTFYRARAGVKLSPAKAQVFLAEARARDPQVVGLRLADGSVVFTPDAIEATLARNVALERELALLRKLAMRRVITAAPVHFQS